MSDEAQPVQPNNQIREVIAVKSDGGQFLFSYHIKAHSIELHKRGLTFMVKIQDLEDFGRTSQRKVFRAYPTPVIVDPAEDEIVRQGFE